MKRNSLFWGMAFILFGALMMLQTLGLMHFNIGRLFWPAMVILLGVWVLWQAQSGGTTLDSENIAIPLDGARQARVVLHHGAGVLHLRAGTSPTNLLEGTFDGGVEQKSQRVGENLELSLKVPQVGFPFIVFPGIFSPDNRIHRDMALTTAVPLALEIRTGANDAHLDLSDLQVTALEIHTGASATEVDLPKQVEFTRVKINAGAASVILNVPDEIAVRMCVDGGLLDVEADPTRFPKAGNVYQSIEYETAPQRVEISVDAGVGSITLR